MNTFNSRRPEGYRGSPKEIAGQLVADARDALAFARTLRARSERGEDVTEEISREEADNVCRARYLVELVRWERWEELGTLATVDADASLERARALHTHCSRVYAEYARSVASLVHAEVERAARFIVEHAGTPRMSIIEIMEDPKAALRAYRRAAMNLHPDHGGDTGRMQDLTAAKARLDRERN